MDEQERMDLERRLDIQGEQEPFDDGHRPRRETPAEIYARLAANLTPVPCDGCNADATTAIGEDPYCESCAHAIGRAA